MHMIAGPKAPKKSWFAATGEGQDRNQGGINGFRQPDFLNRLVEPCHDEPWRNQFTLLFRARMMLMRTMTAAAPQSAADTSNVP